MATASTVSSISASLTKRTRPSPEAYRVDSTNSNSTVCHSSIVNREPCSESNVDDNYVFIPATGITENTVKQQMEVHLNDRSQPCGVRTCMNGKDLALFYWREKLYCVDEKCPHLGGPLHLGDIEDAGWQGGNPCIVCPWHKWGFDLCTGRTTKPHKKRPEKLQLYRVKKGDNGQIRVGFESLHQSFFA